MKLRQAALVLSTTLLMIVIVVVVLVAAVAGFEALTHTKPDPCRAWILATQRDEFGDPIAFKLEGYGWMDTDRLGDRCIGGTGP